MKISAHPPSKTKDDIEPRSRPGFTRTGEGFHEIIATLDQIPQPKDNIDKHSPNPNLAHELFSRPPRRAQRRHPHFGCIRATSGARRFSPEIVPTRRLRTAAASSVAARVVPDLAARSRYDNDRSLAHGLDGRVYRLGSRIS